MKSKKLMAALATLTLGGAAAFGLTFAGCGHTHTYSEEWKYDETGHWHVATCDDLKEGDDAYKSEFAAHDFGDDDECDVCHYKKAPAHEGEEGEGEGEGEGEEGGGEGEEGGGEGEEGGGEGEEGNDPAPVVQTITLDKETLTLSIDNLEDELTATISNGAEDAEIEWESDNESVVLVGEGYVEALKPGSATITAPIKGTEISATRDVLVEDAYYIIGGKDSAWNKCATFNNESFIYFMPTETEGIYKTESFELGRLGNFQVALVGITADSWWQQAFNGDYIASGDTVLSKNDGGNIAVAKSGMYTITLDLTGDKAVVSGVCDEEYDEEDVEDVYYLIGGMNNWTLAGTVEAAGAYAFKDNGDGTYSLTCQLTKGWEFKVVVVGMGYDVEFAESALPRDKIGNNGTATEDTDYQLTWTSSSNIGVGVTGYYTFTLTPDGETNKKLTYEFSLTAPDAETAPDADAE